MSLTRAWGGGGGGGGLSGGEAGNDLTGLSRSVLSVNRSAVKTSDVNVPLNHSALGSVGILVL